MSLNRRRPDSAFIGFASIHHAARSNGLETSGSPVVLARDTNRREHPAADHRQARQRSAARAARARTGRAAAALWYDRTILGTHAVNFRVSLPTVSHNPNTGVASWRESCKTNCSRVSKLGRSAVARDDPVIGISKASRDQPISLVWSQRS
jgi:hypothetical protein